MNRVCLLLSTYNGQQYIREQIDSILRQKNVEILLLVRDDGSTDDTVNILKEYMKMNKNIIMPEELQGYHATSISASFFQLLRYAAKHFPDIYYFGFADQDDVWLPDKINRAVIKLKKYDNRMALYFSNKKMVNAQLQEYRNDPTVFNNNFTDYLSPNDAAGCTMVFNRSFANMLLSAKVERYPQIHDVICMKLALCTDTTIIYDKSFNSMFYRNHGDNASGGGRNIHLFTKNNWHKLISRRKHYLGRLTKDILQDYNNYLSDNAKKKLLLVLSYKNIQNSIKLISLYIKEPNRSWQDKVRFFFVVMLRGI